jgi:hypothetical protein
MGIFDIFTGESGKKAAEENKRLLQENLTRGTGVLNEGRSGALSALDTAAGYYAPLASKYGAATTLGLDALGVNGPEGNQGRERIPGGPGLSVGCRPVAGRRCP